MAVPTPIAYWTLEDPIGATTVTDEISGYVLDVNTGAGTGGVFGEQGFKPGTTCFQNQDTPDNTSDIDADIAAIPGFFTDLGGDLEGSFSIWVKTNVVAGNDIGICEISLTSLSPIALRSFILKAQDVSFTGSTFPRFRVSGNTSSDVVWSSTSWDGEWVQYTATWSDTAGVIKFFVNGGLIGTDTYTSDAASYPDGGEVYAVRLGTTSVTDVNYQRFRVWNVALTEDQAAELYANDAAVVASCRRTIPLSQIRTFWRDVERTLPCRASIQRETITGFETFATNVPVSIELTGTRQELDSSDNYITIQNWLVTMSGRVNLPNPGVFSTVRFLVAGLVLESYDFYQSPDDIQTVIECKKI